MIKLGVSYYPETYDSSQWEGDLRLMKETGLEVIRIFDFAWTTVEPRENVYDWSWLDAFLDLCDKVGMKVILCTPTATPPAWLAYQYPEIMVELRNGTRRPFGGRRDTCMTSPVYRKFSVRIAERMAERYGQRDTVIGWQIDNELFGPEGPPTECHCGHCNFRFREWLKDRYSSLDELNAAWGTRYWNQERGAWNEVTTPRHPRAVNGWVIDYGEFFSDTVAEFMKLQYDAIKALVKPSQWVTHNSTGLFNVGVNHRHFARLMDTGAWDAYVGAAGQPLPITYSALGHEMIRSATMQPFHVLETGSSKMSAAYLAEARARGALSLILWHWRCIPFGAEAGADTLLDYDGTPKPGRLEFIKALRDRLASDEELPAKVEKREAAFVFDWANVRSERRQKNWPRSPYLTTLPKAYHAFWKRGVSVDVVEPGESLAGYKLLIVPALALIDQEFGAQLTEYVSNGGVLWACAPMAHCDTHGKFLFRTGDPVSEVLGVRQKDFRARGEKTVKLDSGETFEVERCSEWIEPTTAEVLGRFTDGQRAGEPAVTVNRLGKGAAYYAACTSQQLGDWLATQAIETAGVFSVANECPDVTAVRHLNNSGAWYCNHSDEQQTVGDITVPPRDFVFVED